MKPLRVTIRAAKTTDVADILGIIKEYMRYDTMFARRYFDRFFSKSDAMMEEDAVYVAVAGTTVVGVIGYSLDYLNAEAYWLGWFAVTGKVRKRKCGTALLRTVERSLRAKGMTKLFVSTEDSNTVAKAFYTNSGFRTEGVVRDYYGDGEDELILSKSLG